MSKRRNFNKTSERTISAIFRAQKMFSLSLFFKIIAFILIFGQLPDIAFGQIRYLGHLTDLRIQELKNVARQIEYSINFDKYPCEDFYDYVCIRNMPVYSILGNSPNVTEIIQLMARLQADEEKFEAKQKLNDFFVSCNTVKRLEDCYRESFEYFKPIFGYIITKYYVNSTSVEHRNFINVLSKFMDKVDRTEDFKYNPIRRKLGDLKESFALPQTHFSVNQLNTEYEDLRIYRESYEHNLRNFDQFRRRNSSYEVGMQRVMLGWTFYLFQSRNKPMTYFFPTLNVHLWMTLYNSSIRYYEPRRLQEIADCLQLKQHVNILGEARVLAVVYLKSFRMAWSDYVDWIEASNENLEIHDKENEVLRKYHYLTNKKIFFILYAQNFCDFGKEIADNIFYFGLRRNFDFHHSYCGGIMPQLDECVP